MLTKGISITNQSREKVSAEVTVKNKRAAIARITPGGFSGGKPSPCAESTGQSGCAGLGRRAGVAIAPRVRLPCFADVALPSLR